MNNVIPFKFKDSDIRTVQLNDEPMFVAKDVATILGYSNVNDAIKRHCEGVVKHDLPTSSGIQSFSLIPEFDVYSLILRSKLPEAKKFKNWVCKEVLPSIRKSGSYQSQSAIPQSFAEALRLAADMADKLEAAKPKIAFADSVNEAINSVSFRDFAKSVGTGQNKLYELLRTEGYLMSSFKDRINPIRSMSIRAYSSCKRMFARIRLVSSKFGSRHLLHQRASFTFTRNIFRRMPHEQLPSNNPDRSPLQPTGCGPY